MGQNPDVQSMQGEIAQHARQPGIGLAKQHLRDRNADPGPCRSDLCGVAVDAEDETVWGKLRPEPRSNVQIDPIAIRPDQGVIGQVVKRLRHATTGQVILTQKSRSE